MENKFPIPGFPGYHITLTGKVWSDRSNRFLTIGLHDYGYHHVGLMTEGHPRAYNIARLLLTTFVRPPLPEEEAHHLNDIKTDDELSNLAWGTPVENRQDMIRNGHCPCFAGEKNGGSKVFPLDVINIRLLHSVKKLTPTVLGKIYKLSPGAVADIIHRRSWKHI